MKLVVNRCYGGFGLSKKALMRYAELTGITLYPITNKRKGESIDFDHYVPYDGNDDGVLIHYLTKPLLKDGTFENDSYFYPDWDRADPLLVQVVEELGGEASGQMASLEIVEIPDGIQYEINDYDGIETVHEVHRSL